MDDLQASLGALLNNPAIMSQVMSMAQSLGQQQPPPAAPPPPPPPESGGLPDPALLQKLMGLASCTGIDPNQQQLLRALSAYLSPQRIQKLEKAMQAAKLAQFAADQLIPAISAGR